MKQARLDLTDAAATDIVEQFDWYIAQAGQALAMQWDKAVTAAILRVLKNPASGTPCAFLHSELNNVRRVSIGGLSKTSDLLPLLRSNISYSSRRSRCAGLGALVIKAESRSRFP